MENKGPNRIDIVYLWVNGADPVWSSKRQIAYSSWREQNSNELAVYGNVEGRYRDNGEFRYNLRALETFFPEHGHVHIVTDGQCPDWLHQSNGISIVDHRDLIPSRARPVFDSGHIESYIHHIRNLSEKFFYLNDDVFFGAPVDPEYWFGQRMAVFTESEALPASASPQRDFTATINAAILSRDWLSTKYPKCCHDPRPLAHAPRPFLKSALHAFEESAADLFRRARSTVFRTWDLPSIISDLAPRWMVKNGLARLECSDATNISTGAECAEGQFAALRRRFGKVPFFCINDTCDDADRDDPRLLRVGLNLEELLPQPSSFEIISARELNGPFGRAQTADNDSMSFGYG
jgi:hypothetical protein